MRTPRTELGITEQLVLDALRQTGSATAAEIPAGPSVGAVRTAIFRLKAFGYITHDGTKGKGCRASKIWRITPDGRRALSAHKNRFTVPIDRLAAARARTWLGKAMQPGLTPAAVQTCVSLALDEVDAVLGTQEQAKEAA